MFSLILLSGGLGTRMGQEIPKQFLMLAGKPVIMHTIERIDKIDKISELIIVCHKNYHTLLSSYLDAYSITTDYKIVSGGNTRQESSYLGLKAASNDLVIIHEAARPFVKRNEFEQLINHSNFNAIFAHSIPFTVLKGNTKITELLNREELLNVQLPQKFEKSPLLDAHEKAKSDCRNFTEDASLFYFYTSTEISILPGTVYNNKITEPIDLAAGELIYKDYIVGRD